MLQIAHDCWEAGASFRKNRLRCKDYAFGRQWNDTIEVNGRKITEYEYILSEGNIPLKNNLIRRIIRNVEGVFRRRLADEMEKWESPLRDIAAANSLYELYARTMEEFLISGMAVHRKWFGRRRGVAGVWTEMVSPSGFFFDRFSRDVRGWDAEVVGEFHSVGFNDWCDAFVRDSKGYDHARRLFTDHRHVKVAEIWRRERRPRRRIHDRSRGLIYIKEAEEGRGGKGWFLDDVWRYYFVAPDGTVIAQGDSPYRHGGHPFVYKCYPFLDGEIQSFVGDIIDQQRYANRLITLYDWVIRASAKGVLLLPEGAVDPEDYQDVADEWGRFNGVIVYKAKAGQPEPRQVNGTTGNLGISELLDIQLKMLEDVSGVNGALQGNLAATGVSGTLYSQQTANSLTSLSDILDTFASFISDCRRLDLSLHSQLTGK